MFQSVVDFTNPQSRDWWTGRLEELRSNYGIDSFKFDAGESNWLPSSIKLDDSIPRDLWPAAFTKSYVETVANFGPMIEVRVGRRTQRFNFSCGFDFVRYSLPYEFFL